MSTGGPDLFVVCKSCGSEVSPYITECPYCGNRLRKRAPKIDREGRVSERRPRRPQAPSLPRLRRGEIPGIRGEAHPRVTIALVVLGLVGCLLWRTALVDLTKLAIVEPPGKHWWRLFTAAFTYTNTFYAFFTLTAIALFGWLLERRHGPFVVIALFLLGGVGGLIAGVAVYSTPFLTGASGAALAFIVAWALPDLIDLRRGEAVEGDLLGAAVFAAVIALMPVADVGASWVADVVGAAAGLLVGLPLARSTSR
jgi:membrane associated rhomboid family serine protease